MSTVIAAIVVLAVGASAGHAFIAPSTWEFRFASDTRRAERDTFLRAADRIGPNARRLLRQIDERVTASFGPIKPGSAGVTVPRKNGRYSIRIARWVMVHRNPAAPRHVVLHELGHVIDRALIPSRVREPLAAKVPCPPDVDNCNPAERFADGFAVWAKLTHERPDHLAAKERALVKRWNAALRPFARPPS